MIKTFCEWFEGEFDNWSQAASNPTKWAHIIVKHEKIGMNMYHTTSRYSYMDVITLQLYGQQNQNIHINANH